MDVLWFNNTCATLLVHPGNLPGCWAAEPTAGGSIISHEEARRVPSAGGRCGEPQEATPGVCGKSHRKAVYIREPSSSVAKVKKQCVTIPALDFKIQKLLMNYFNKTTFFGPRRIMFGPIALNVVDKIIKISNRKHFKHWLPEKGNFLHCYLFSAFHLKICNCLNIIAP